MLILPCNQSYNIQINKNIFKIEVNIEMAVQYKKRLGMVITSYLHNASIYHYYNYYLSDLGSCDYP